VVRDRAMHRLARRLGLELGTGYPSDPRTLAHLRSALALGTQIPEWIRRSWSTTERLKPRIAASRLEAFDQ
jgi:ribonuclease HII